jgi:uncharacterized protein YciI
MFVVTLNYKKSLSDVDRLVDEHRAFLEHHYIFGHFLLSRRKEPRTGGIILSKADTATVAFLQINLLGIFTTPMGWRLRMLWRPWR